MREGGGFLHPKTGQRSKPDLDALIQDARLGASSKVSTMPFLLSEPQSLTTCEGHPQRSKSARSTVLTRSPFHVSPRRRPMTSTCFSVSALPMLKAETGTRNTIRAFLHPICIVKSATQTHGSSRGC